MTDAEVQSEGRAARADVLLPALRRVRFRLEAGEPPEPGDAALLMREVDGWQDLSHGLARIGPLAGKGREVEQCIAKGLQRWSLPARLAHFAALKRETMTLDLGAFGAAEAVDDAGWRALIAWVERSGRST